VERKQARVSDGGGGLGLGQQVQENREQQEHLPMNGVEGSVLNAPGVMLADEDPIVYGLCFPFPSLSFSLCHVQRAFVFSGWQTNAVLASWRGAPRPNDGGRIYSLL